MAGSSAVTKDRLLRSVVSAQELTVLKSLESFHGSDSVGIDIAELVGLSGLEDTEEVLRGLYTLEGKRLVEPYPSGDLTSSRWKITELGLSTLEYFRS